MGELVRLGATLPPVRITLPDGTVLSSARSDLNRILSGVLKREVTLAATGSGQREIVESASPHPWCCCSAETSAATAN